MTPPLKIYPSIEECQIKNNIVCPVEDCYHTFTSEANLNLHITKTHKKSDLKPSVVEKQYFCPDITCPWNNVKHFKKMKNLRQHYLKVHTEKKFSCPVCQKSFANEVMLSRHKDYCNVMFLCLDCKSSYDCYDTLKTHSRRKKHKILNKAEYKGIKSSEQTQKKIVTDYSERLILPKGSLPITQFLSSGKSSNADQNSQTIQEKPILESKMTQVTHDNDMLVSHSTQHTQTGSKNGVLSVETQTCWDFEINRTKGQMLPNVKLEILEENYKDINTQTDMIESRENSCNTTFNLKDFELTFNSYIETNSSSTQTYFPNSSNDIFSISTTTHDSIHTDTSDLLTDSLSTFDTNFFNCHTETQTDFMFDNEIFNADYYSNMYTQTCDEILSGLNGFNDIQTQTAFDETLRSVESQTLMTSIDKITPNTMKDIVHSETQTDAEFREMLEIINS